MALVSRSQSAVIDVRHVHNVWLIPFCAVLRQAIVQESCPASGLRRRQAEEAELLKRDEALHLPPDLDYGALGTFSAEDEEMLSQVRPPTLAAAKRIPGVSPSAILRLHRHVQGQDSTGRRNQSSPQQRPSHCEGSEPQTRGLGRGPGG